METRYPQFTPGQKVKTIYGETCTVLMQRGCQVFLVEQSFGWFHPTKVFAFKAAR